MCILPVPALAADTPVPIQAGDPGWYDYAWQYRKSITIDKTRVAGDLADFPVLVMLASDTDLRSGARGNGDDILFTAGDGTTRLFHEIERYSAGTGGLVAWVKVPLLSSTSDTKLYLYFGNADAPAQEKPAQVWSNAFHGVWHLGEKSGPALDSTSFGTRGVYSGSYEQGETGKIGLSAEFDDDDGYGKAEMGDPGDGHLDFGSGSFTVSLWMNLDENRGTGQRVLQKGGTSAGTKGYLIETTPGAAKVFGAIADGSRRIMTPAASISLESWTHVVTVLDRNSNRFRIFRNGAEISSPGSDIKGLGSISTGRAFGLSDLTYGFEEGVDEVRVAGTARPATWIRTEYNNQNSPSSFYTLGGKENGSTVTPMPTPTPGSCTVEVDTTSPGTVPGASTTLTITHTTSGLDRLMLVGVSHVNDDYETVTSVTYNGDPLTLVVANATVDDSRIEIWRLIAPDTGTHDVVITFSAAITKQAFGGVMTFTGVDQVTPLSAYASQVYDESKGPANITVQSAIGEMVFGVMSSEYEEPTTDAGQTERWKQGSGSQWGAGSTRTGASSVKLEWGFADPAAAHWATGAVSIRPCGGATPTPASTPTPTPDVTPAPAEPTPTLTPAEPAETPTPAPTMEPMETPTVGPTPGPTMDPTPEPTVEPTPAPTIEPTETPTVEPTPGPAPAFTCPAGTYGLVTPDGETTGCVAITNEWAYNETSNLAYNTIFVSLTAAENAIFTGASVGISVSLDPVTPQYSEIFDPGSGTRSHTFAIELPSYYDDVQFFYLTVFGTMEKVTDGGASPEMGVSVPDNPIEYISQG